MTLHPHTDLLLYAVHAGFWGAFGITLVVRGEGGAAAPAATPAPAASEAKTAPHSRAVLAFHMLAFGVMYFGIGSTVIPDLVPYWFAGQRIAGTIVITVGAALAAWALVYFRSWRFRAKLDEGHQLATGGPFALLRHPIYMALNLLAIGSALWVPTPVMAVACVLMIVGSDLRGRAEEKLLASAFGATYRGYCARTKRFLPGVY